MDWRRIINFESHSKLFFPSLTCLIISLFCLNWSLKGSYPAFNNHTTEEIEPLGVTVFCLGIASLVFVPIFKIVTGLPPFMGIIFGLALLWLVTDLIHSRHDDRNHLRVPQIITKIDTSSVMFFLGILLAIDALQTAGLLTALAGWMDRTIGNPDVIAIAIGLASAIVDNVPLVAAVMGMYDLSHYPPDSNFWDMVAFCAGTGGSILLIGSAAGVVFMGLERVQFFWYFRRISFAALAGYFAGIAVFKFLRMIDNPGKKQIP